MPFLFGLLAKKAGAIAALVIVVLLLSALGVQSMRLGWARHETEKARAALVVEQGRVRDLLKVNSDEHATVVTLGADLGKWKKMATDAQAGWDAAVAQATKYEAAVNKLSNDLRKAKEADNALPECQKYLATDIAAVCPGHAVGVRERAAGVPRPSG